MRFILKATAQELCANGGTLSASPNSKPKATSTTSKEMCLTVLETRLVPFIIMVGAYQAKRTASSAICCKSAQRVVYLLLMQPTMLPKVSQNRTCVRARAGRWWSILCLSEREAVAAYKLLLASKSGVRTCVGASAFMTNA